MLNILFSLFILKCLSEFKRTNLIENKLGYAFLGCSIITFLEILYVLLTHLYYFIEFLLQNKFFKRIAISLYKTIQNDPNFTIRELLSVFSFLIVQFIAFLIVYLYLLYIQRSRNISSLHKKYLTIFKQIFPLVLFAIIMTEFIYNPFIGYLSVNYTFLYLMLLFISFYSSLKEFKKDLICEPNEKLNSYIIFFSLLIVCFLILLTCVFLFILLTPNFNAISEDSLEYEGLMKSLYYLSVLVALILMYLISYWFVYNIDSGISKFNKIKCIFYLILFVLYIYSRLNNFLVDSSIFKINVLGNVLNLSSAISDSSTEALLTVVIFDSFFQNFLEFKKNK